MPADLSHSLPHAYQPMRFGLTEGAFREAHAVIDDTQANSLLLPLQLDADR
jgi:hypothetical protein